MRLSTVFELLLIFLLIAFAAYGRVIDRDELTSHRAVRAVNESRQGNLGVSVISLKQAAENVNKYCICDTFICNCCRNFNIPIVQLKGPGCVSLQYLEKNQLGVQLSMGNNILTSTMVNGNKPKAVCFPMPGGLSKFCGRIYSIQREDDEHFKACLGLELESASELEAALRVSCFRFGPKGVSLRPAEELPIVEEPEQPAAEDDDDDDDLFGLDDDDDDDEDDEETDAPAGNAVAGSTGTAEDDEDDDDDDDVLGLDTLFDFIAGDDDSDKKKPQVTTAAPLLPFTIPILTKPTPGSPPKIPSSHEITESAKPITANTESLSQTVGNDASTTAELATGSAQDVSEITGITNEAVTELFTNSAEEAATTDLSTSEETSSKITASSSTTVVDNVIKQAEKQTTKKPSIIGKKKPSLTSGSLNAIRDDAKKPVVSSVILTKPTKPDPVQNYVASQNLHQQEEDDDDDDDVLGAADLDDEDDDDEDEEEEEDDDENDTDDDDDDDNVENNVSSSEQGDKIQNDKDQISEDNKHEETNEEQEVVEDLIDDDDEDDEEEEEAEEDAAVISAIVNDGVEKIQDKVASPVPPTKHDDDDDYDLEDLLARRRSFRRGRQSKVMRL